MLYRSTLDRDLLPTFGSMCLDQSLVLRSRPGTADFPLTGGQATRTAYGAAAHHPEQRVDDEVLAATPATIKGAGQTKYQRSMEPRSRNWRPSLLACPSRTAWPCSWRSGVHRGLARSPSYGAATRRGRGNAKDHRAMTFRDGHVLVGAPTLDAGRRDLTVPPHLRDALIAHLSLHARPRPDGLLFPSVRPPRGSCGCGCGCGYDGCSGVT
jgi:hypothetical protein